MRTWCFLFFHFLLCLWWQPSIKAQSLPDSGALPPLLREYDLSDANGTTTDSVITLSKALEKVITRNPLRLASYAEIAAARGRLQQSRYRLNPELSAEVEDIGRSSASGPSQTTIGVSQLFELFGKRKARRDVAEAGVTASEFNAQFTLLQLYYETALRFGEAVGAKERVLIAHERLTLMQSIQEAVQVKVTDGAVPKVELLRAQSATKLAEIQLSAAQSEASGSRLALSSLWGGQNADFEIEGALDWWLNNPVDSLSFTITDNPELAGLRAALATSEAEVRLARSLGKPDITFGAGYRRLHDDRDNGILFSVSLPLPLFDRNKGGVVEAASNLDMQRARISAVQQRLHGELQRHLITLRVQQQQVILLKEQILPSARQVLEELDLAYRLGSQPYINVLDAQRTLADLQSQLIDALLIGTQAAIEIESITGHRIASVRR